MPITARTIVNFNGGTAVSVQTANNITSTGTGTVAANLVDINNAATGVSLLCSDPNRYQDGNGRAAGVDTLAQQINASGIYTDMGGGGTCSYVLQLPSGHGPVNVRVFLCTQYDSQEDLDVTVNGSTTTDWDATNNVSGASLLFSSVMPNGSNQVVIQVYNESNQYVFWNGFVVEPVPGATINAGSEALALAVHQASVQLSGAVNAGVEALNLATLPATVLLSGQFSDDFEAAGGNGPLTGWTAFNAAALPDVARVNGYYDSGVIDARGDTLWFNGSRGRADWKTRPIPVSGEDQYIFRGVGIGPAANPQANLSYTGGGQYSFCGIVVHRLDTSGINYEFLVVGHRGAEAASTLEGKTTADGASAVSDLGSNTLGAGVTHADIRLQVRSDGTLRWSYRVANSNDPWIDVDFGEGAGVLPGGGLTFSGHVRIGLIAYTDEEDTLAFRGTVAEALLVNEIPPAPIGAGSESLQLITPPANIEFAMEIAAAAEALSLQTLPAAIRSDRDIVAGVESLVLTPLAASVVADSTISAATESLSLATHQAQIAIGLSVQAERITLATLVAVISSDRSIAGEVEALTLTALPAQVISGSTIGAATEQLSLATQPAQITIDARLTAQTEVLVLSSLSAQVGLAQHLDTNVESLVITPQGATVTLEGGITADVALLSLSTLRATLQLPVPPVVSAGLQYTIPADRAHYTIPVDRINVTFRS